MTMPEWTHTVTVRWKVRADSDDEAWEIGEEILRTALCETPTNELDAIHDDTDVKRITRTS